MDRSFVEKWDIYGAGEEQSTFITPIGVPNRPSGDDPCWSHTSYPDFGFNGTSYGGVADGKWGTSVAFTDANTVVVGAPVLRTLLAV